MKKLAFALVTALALTAGAARADDATVLREVQDRAAIEALMWRYVRALDTLDANAYAAVFTEDGSFGSGSQARKGRADLRKMIEDLKRGRAEREAANKTTTPAMYHVITNDSIEFVSANEARYYSYWMTVFGAGGQDTPPRIAAVGRGIDELVRVNGQWLIKNRNVAPQ